MSPSVAVVKIDDEDSFKELIDRYFDKGVIREVYRLRAMDAHVYIFIDGVNYDSPAGDNKAGDNGAAVREELKKMVAELCEEDTDKKIAKKIKRLNSEKKPPDA